MILQATLSYSSIAFTLSGDAYPIRLLPLRYPIYRRQQMRPATNSTWTQFMWCRPTSVRKQQYVIHQVAARVVLQGQYHLLSLPGCLPLPVVREINQVVSDTRLIETPPMKSLRRGEITQRVLCRMKGVSPLVEMDGTPKSVNFVRL